MHKCPVCGSDVSDKIDSCPFCKQIASTPPQEIDVHMGWYNFILWIQVPLNILNGLYTAINSFMSIGNPQYLTKLFGIQLPLLPISYGIFLISTLTFSLCMHYALRKRHFYVLKLLIIFNLMPVVTSSINILPNMVVDDAPNLIAKIISGLVLAFINYIYFNNRKHLFVNTNSKTRLVAKYLFALTVITYVIFLLIKWFSIVA